MHSWHQQAVIMKVNEPVRTKNDIVGDVMKRDAEVSKYFSGTRLYGDNFSLYEINIWCEGEKEGFTHRSAARGGLRRREQAEES